MIKHILTMHKINRYKNIDDLHFGLINEMISTQTTKTHQT